MVSVIENNSLLSATDVFIFAFIRFDFEQKVIINVKLKSLAAIVIFYDRF